MLPTELVYYYIKKLASDHLVGLCVIERVSKINDTRRFLSGGQLAMTQLLLATGTKYKYKIYKYTNTQLHKYTTGNDTTVIDYWAKIQISNTYPTFLLSCLQIYIYF